METASLTWVRGTMEVSILVEVNSTVGPISVFVWGFLVFLFISCSVFISCSAKGGFFTHTLSFTLYVLSCCACLAPRLSSSCFRVSCRLFHRRSLTHPLSLFSLSLQLLSCAPSLALASLLSESTSSQFVSIFSRSSLAVFQPPSIQLDKSEIR